jgi:hypothetical protein
MPTDDIFDAAWGVAADDEIKKFGFIEGLARDFGFTDYANRMREQQEARDKLNAAVRQQMIIDPNAMTNIRAEQARMQQAAQEQTRMDELEARLAELRAELTNRDTVEGTVDDTMGTPPGGELSPEPPVSDSTTTADAVVAQPPPSDLDVESDPSLSVIEPKTPTGKERAELGDSFEEPKAEEKKRGELVSEAEVARAKEGMQASDYALAAFDVLTGRDTENPPEQRTAQEYLTNQIKMANDGNRHSFEVLQQISAKSAKEAVSKTTGIPVNELTKLLRANLKSAKKAVNKDEQIDREDNMSMNNSENVATETRVDNRGKKNDKKGLERYNLTEGQVEAFPEVVARTGDGEANIKRLPNIMASTDPSVVNYIMSMAEDGDERARKHLYNSMGDLEDHFPAMAERYQEIFGKASADIDSDIWSIVKDPFANPFFNQNAFSLTDQKPPEVTYDDSPVFEVDTSLIKGPSPEDALNDAGFDTRQGDDVSLLPSSVFRQGESAPVDNTSLLPKGWKTSE